MSGWHIDNVELPDGTIKPVAAYGNSEDNDLDYEGECELELAERMRDEND
jgi:hypothetical protein